MNPTDQEKQEKVDALANHVDIMHTQANARLTALEGQHGTLHVQSQTDRTNKYLKEQLANPKYEP